MRWPASTRRAPALWCVEMYCASAYPHITKSGSRRPEMLQWQRSGPTAAANDTRCAPGASPKASNAVSGADDSAPYRSVSSDHRATPRSGHSRGRRCLRITTVSGPTVLRGPPRTRHSSRTDSRGLCWSAMGEDGGERRGDAVRPIVRSGCNGPAGGCRVQRRVAGAALAIGAALAMTAGCSSTTEGSPTTPTDTAADLWDPCTQIPDSALTAAQVDPSTKKSGIAGVEQHGWKICAWKGRQYSISVYSAGKSASEIANKTGNTGQRNITMAGREGTEFRSGGETECDIVFGAKRGAVHLQVIGRLAEDNPIDPCPTLSTVGEAVVPSFPS